MASHFARKAARQTQAAAELELARTLEAAPDAEHIETLRGVLQIASTATLVGFLRTGIDARMMLAHQLADRGLSQDGNWVGFAEADRLFRAAFPNYAMVAV